MTKEIGPIVYGYSMTVGPDGKPVIREFGNVKRGPSKEWKEAISDTREPLVDVVEGDKEVRVIAELPGAKKQDIELTVDGKSLDNLRGDAREEVPQGTQAPELRRRSKGPSPNSTTASSRSRCRSAGEGPRAPGSRSTERLSAVGSGLALFLQPCESVQGQVLEVVHLGEPSCQLQRSDHAGERP